MRKTIAAVLVVAGVAVAGMVAASGPAVAESGVVCQAPNWVSDGGFYDLVSLTYTLPSGRQVVVTDATGQVDASYAVSRGVLTEVCMVAPPSR